MNIKAIKKDLAGVYECLPRAWVEKEGNVGFNEYAKTIRILLNLWDESPSSSPNVKPRVLDIGMSMGVVACFFAGRGWEVYGCDYLENMDHPLLKPIRDKFSIDYRDYDASVDDLPYENNFFDIVNCNDVIEHLHCSPKRMLTESYRVLRDGGLLFVSNPNIAALHNRLMLLFGGSVHASIRDWYHNPLWQRERYTGHVREYAPWELRYVIKQAGFTSCKASSFMALPGTQRPQRTEDLELDCSGQLGYLREAPFYSRDFKIRRAYDWALLFFYLATLPLKRARLEAWASGTKSAK